METEQNLFPIAFVDPTILEIEIDKIRKTVELAGKAVDKFHKILAKKSPTAKEKAWMDEIANQPLFTPSFVLSPTVRARATQVDSNKDGQFDGWAISAVSPISVNGKTVLVPLMVYAGHDEEGNRNIQLGITVIRNRYPRSPGMVSKAVAESTSDQEFKYNAHINRLLEKVVEKASIPAPIIPKTDASFWGE